MKFPDINYNFNDFSEGKGLVDIVEQKFAVMEKYIHDNQSVSCDVEFSKVSSNQSGKINKIEVNLMIDGVLYRAEAVEDSFEKAIDEVKTELDKGLRRAKEKQSTLDKQVGREIKEQMLGN